MANKDRYKTKQFIDAIPGTGGIISEIARKVGCDWITAKKYVTKYPTIAQAYMNECESVLDMAESNVIGLMEKSDAGMLKYYLSTKGKKRGYVERTEVTGKDGGSVVISWDETDKD